jgi:hypothetical protein
VTEAFKAGMNDVAAARMFGMDKQTATAYYLAWSNLDTDMATHFFILYCAGPLNKQLL